MPSYTRDELHAFYNKTMHGCMYSTQILLDVVTRLIIKKFMKFLSKDEIDDLIQNTFLKILKTDSFDNDKASFATFALLIAQQECNDYLRKKNRRAKKHGYLVDDGSEIPTYNRSIDDFAQSEIIAKIDAFCVSQYPDIQQFFYLHYFKGLTIDQCSLAMRVPVGTLKSKSSRVYKVLRENFKEKDKVA
jgi:RNA polymerase sigma-70 factor (ECF subfamily)